jgi:DNA-binding MarR family transcriptional regulator
MARFNILGILGDEKDATYKSYHAAWRTFNKAKGEPFFALYNGFKEKHLAKLDAGPLRLYLYFGFHANNRTGASWHSISKIAEFFGTQTRTIDNWISVLVKEGLIYRERTDKRSHTTYLIPYSDTLIKQRPRKRYEEDSQEMFEDLLSVIQSRDDVYGQITKVYHLFQWGIKKKLKKPSMDSNIQWIFILTKREDVLIGHAYPLKHSSHLGVSLLTIDEVATFQSPFQYNHHPVTGIALNHITRISDSSNYDDILYLIRDLALADEEILEQHPALEYGEISAVLQEELEEEKITEDEDTIKEE